jgi:hypothetical protein
MFPFLTLDQSTLFYWTLSDVPPKRDSVVHEWASAITAHSKSTALKGPKSTSSRTKSIIPSLTGGASRSVAPSVLTDNIKVISRQSSDQVKVKVESQADVISLSEGGLSDNDELGGKEREIAINSPPKGKKRITSEVSSKKPAFSIDHTESYSYPATRISQILKGARRTQKASKRGTTPLD